MNVRTSALSIALAGTVMLVAGSAARVEAGANPSSCDALFNLPASTVSLSTKDQTVMSPEVCAAYQDLIDRYNPGPCSSVGLTNPKVSGILHLNPQFALHLDQMLKAMPGQIGINSAFRTGGTDGGQQCANSKAPNSNHTKGCAVDLGYGQNNCGSAACQWVMSHAGQYGLRIRMPVAPEWNHIEPADLASCQAGGQGNYSPTFTPPPYTDSNDDLGASPNGANSYCIRNLNPVVVWPTNNTPPGALCQQSTTPFQQPMMPMQPTLPQQTTQSTQTSSASNLQPIYYTAPTSSALLLSATTSAGTSTSSTLQDLLNALAGGTTTPNTSTSSPTVSVNLVSTDTSLIIIQMQTGQQQPVPPGQNPYAAQQTFTSPDMSGGAPATVPAPPQTGVTTFSNNPVQLILGGIRAVLLKMLAYLQGLSFHS